MRVLCAVIVLFIGIFLAVNGSKVPKRNGPRCKNNKECASGNCVAVALDCVSGSYDNPCAITEMKCRETAYNSLCNDRSDGVECPEQFTCETNAVDPDLAGKCKYFAGVGEACGSLPVAGSEKKYKHLCVSRGSIPLACVNQKCAAPSTEVPIGGRCKGDSVCASGSSCVATKLDCFQGADDNPCAITEMKCRETAYNSLCNDRSDGVECPEQFTCETNAVDPDLAGKCKYFAGEGEACGSLPVAGSDKKYKHLCISRGSIPLACVNQKCATPSTEVPIGGRCKGDSVCANGSSCVATKLDCFQGADDNPCAITEMKCRETAYNSLCNDRSDGVECAKGFACETNSENADLAGQCKYMAIEGEACGSRPVPGRDSLYKHLCRSPTRTPLECTKGKCIKPSR